MAEDTRANGDRLATLEHLGEGTVVADRMFAMIGQVPFFAELDQNDVRALAGFMQVYRAQSGEVIIREGEPGDYMILLIQGQVDILKKGRRRSEQHMTTVLPGMTLGEMSMFDGEPRFATCVAKETTTFVMLTRDDMARIIHENPRLGAKILTKLVSLLSQRLRQTSHQLLEYMER
jgi:CRP/FNR family cyclic AMP-dependent transcriptional regulator